MQIENMMDHEDGSATFTVEATKEEIQYLVEAGLIALLMKYVEDMKQKCPIGTEYLKGKDNV